MKQTVVLMCLVFLGIAGLSNCKQKTESADKPEMKKVDNTGPEYTSMYICPMHCAGSGSNQAGVCPVCGMDYELNPDYKAPEQESPKDENQEGKDHEGHNHSEGDGHSH